jgi:hypothetical protein
MKLPFLLLAAAMLPLAACSRPAAPAPSAPAPAAPATTEKDEHHHDEEEHHEDDHHHHEAPHGGTLVELGDHAANLEFLLDASEGRLTMYALDAHAENPVRLDATAIPISITPRDGDPIEVTLQPRANALSGETVGDTSEFFVEDARLKTLQSAQILIPQITVRGVSFSSVSFAFPQGVH